MSYVYILINKDETKTYTGSTDNLERRLKEHSRSHIPYIRRFGPWKLLYQEEIPLLKEARKREKYLKSASGRKFVKKIFDQHSGVAQR